MGVLRYITLTEPSNPAQPRHLAYWEWGDPANPDIVLCAHGLSRNGRDFDFLARELAARYRVICPDMAGRGMSDWLVNKADYTYPLYAADCVALLDGLGIAALDWIGTSMGGIIGMMLAAGFPARIRRLVLNDVGCVVSAAGLKRILSYVGSASVFKDEGEAMQYLQSVIAPWGITGGEQWQHIFSASFTRLADGRFALAYDPGISQPFRQTASASGEVADIDLSMFWDHVHCPALILRGGVSDILARSTAEAMCKRKSATELAEFAGIGHAPALLDEAQISTITNWLARPT